MLQQSILDKLIPVIIFTAYFVFRYLGIDVNSLAGDEPFSVYFAQMPIGDVIRHLKPGNNPPLYELILHFWIKIFGIGEISVRFPSLLFSAATCTTLYLIGLRYFNQLTGITASFLFLFSNYATYFAHEARTYALFGFVTALSILLTLKLVEGKTIRKAVVWGLVNGILMYTHYFGVMVIVIEVIAIFLLMRKEKAIKPLLIGIGVSVLLFSPYISVVVERFINMQEEGTWLQKPQGFATLKYMLNQFAGSSKLALISIVVLIIGLVKQVYTQSKNRNAFWLIFALFVIPFFGMFIVSYQIPMFHNRYLMHAFVPFILLLAISANGLMNKRTYDFALAMFLVASFAIKSQINVDNGRHIKEAVAEIKSLSENNERVVIYPKHRVFGYAYYFNRNRFKEYDREYGFYNVIEGFKDDAIYFINQYSEARIDTACCDKVVFAMTDSGPKDQIMNEFKKEYDVTETEHFPEIIDVIKFEKTKKKTPTLD